MRFYRKKSRTENGLTKHFACFSVAGSSTIEVEITPELSVVLDELQQEHWRLEKREQRHCVHLDAIPEYLLPIDYLQEIPENEIVRNESKEQLAHALLQIPEKQRRRMILRYVYDLPIKKIAKIEDCSERAVKYSIRLAKENLKDILEEWYLI